MIGSVHKIQVKKGFNRMDQDIETLVDVMEAKDILPKVN